MSFRTWGHEQEGFSSSLKVTFQSKQRKSEIQASFQSQAITLSGQMCKPIFTTRNLSKLSTQTSVSQPRLCDRTREQLSAHKSRVRHQTPQQFNLKPALSFPTHRCHR